MVNSMFGKQQKQTNIRCSQKIENRLTKNMSADTVEHLNCGTSFLLKLNYILYQPSIKKQA